jgi:hypothetical protein
MSCGEAFESYEELEKHCVNMHLDMTNQML